LKLSMQTADEAGSRLILATDPDADRLAVAEKLDDGTWKIFTGNEIGAILGHWAWLKFKTSHPQVDPALCVVINSTVSSKFLAAVAATEGFSYEETLTGFKWIGGLAKARVTEGKHLIFAFEEAIGFMVGDVCYDKDGIRAAAVCAEMAIHLFNKGVSLYQQLQSLYNTYGYFITKNGYFFCYDPVKLEAIFNAIRNYNNSGKYPTACGKYIIKHVRDLTVGYDDSQFDNKAILPTSPSTQMITFFFEIGCVATLRGSGTEPKLKYYTELNGNDSVQVQAILEDIVSSVIETCLRPTENDLLSPAN